MSIRKICLHVWSKWDPIYFSFSRLDFVKNEWGKQTIIRVRLTRYKGRNITLMDGTIIHKNDLLIKIHLHNVKLLKEIQTHNSDIRRAFIIYKNVEQALPLLASYIHPHVHNNQTKGVIGITTLYKGCKKLGFEVFPLRNPYYKRMKQLALFPIHFISSARLRIEIPTPMYLTMSKDDLLKKYPVKQ